MNFVSYAMIMGRLVLPFSTENKKGPDSYDFDPMTAWKIEKNSHFLFFCPLHTVMAILLVIDKDGEKFSFPLLLSLTYRNGHITGV